MQLNLEIRRPQGQFLGLPFQAANTVLGKIFPVA